MSRVLQYKRFFVTGADCALRYGLLILFFGPACSRSAALGSLNHVLRTRVQSEYCASVSFYLFWDTDAVGVLRYGLLILFFGPACSRSAALGSLNHVLRTRVQSEYCASVSFYLFWDTDAVGVLRYGLLILFFGPACSRSAALGSLNHVLRTRVQIARCVRVS